MKRQKMKSSSFAIPSKRKYPINTPGRRKNAIARVQQHGSPAEKRAVFSAIRRKDPGLAKRSSVIPTKGGSGRHYGDPIGKKHG
jgi:hypothetical protein